MGSKDFSSRLFYWNVFIRLSIVVFLTVIVYLLSENLGYIPCDPINLIRFVVLSFLASLFYVLWNMTGLWRQGLVWTQIFFDIIIVSLVVFWSGGTASPFNFLYVVIILGSCLMGGRLGGSFALVFSLVGFAISSRLALHPGINLGEAVFTFFVNMAAYSLTAFIGVYLSQNLYSSEKHLVETKKHLKQMEEINRRIADNLTFGLITVSGDGNLLSFNQAAVQILGKRLDSFLGKPISEIFPDSDYLSMLFKKDNTDNRFEMIYKNGNNKKILGISTFFLSEKKENLNAYGITFQDITVRKAEEERLKRMDCLASLGQMAAGLAHEIRNPLASLSGAAQLLKEEKDANPLGRKLVEIIEREAGRLDELASSFLNYASPKAGKKQIVDINKECEELLILLKQKKEFSSVMFDAEIAKDLEFYVNPGQFRQVMLNFLMNAAQSLPMEGGRVRLEAFEKDEKIIMKVSDNGKGINEDDLSKIFNPFFTTRPDGVGLGLSIVHQMVVSWGGDIQVESKPGEGTTFTLVIPKKENEMLR